MRGLKDKVRIIAGGARGIGAATTRRLYDEGAKLVIENILIDKLKEAAKNIAGQGGNIHAISLDRTKAQAQKMPWQWLSIFKVDWAFTTPIWPAELTG